MVTATAATFAMFSEEVNTELGMLFLVSVHNNKFTLIFQQIYI